VASEVFAMTGTTKRMSALWPFLACVVLVVVFVFFTIGAVLNRTTNQTLTTIPEVQTPLSAPTALDAARPDDGSGEGGSTDSGMPIQTSAFADGENIFANDSMQILPTDRSAEIIVPPSASTESALVWHEPWEESVWVPMSYWRVVHHVEVYGTREVMGSVCFDGTPLPSGLSTQETIDFVAEHGGGYNTGVVSSEVYLLRPAYVERELVQGGAYRQIHHEGYWSYN
jgi:hypothetical protein